MPLASPTVLRRPIAHDIDHLRRHLGGWESPAMLEGGAGQGPAGRWSILAARPRRVIESMTGRGFRSWGDGLDLDPPREALDGLAQLCRTYRLADSRDDSDPESSPFQGGLIGHFGYDLAPTLERLPRLAPADSRIPALRFALYDSFLAIDHQSATTEIWAVDLLDEGQKALQSRLDAWLADLDRKPPDRLSRTRLTRRPASLTREQYEAKVSKTLDYIRAGDIFQANLSQRFESTGEVEPLDLHAALRKSSPAPYSAYLRWDDLAIVGASPELFFRLTGDHIVTRPIKGTRPRSDNFSEDEHLAAELRNSSKDRAELTMIVDLERNDLGRVCRFGTVQVSEEFLVESFAHVHHLVSTVEGRLRPDLDIASIIRAVFPGGSITGAPKIRAMEIIDELEASRRSVYTGAVGFLGRNGQSAFNIAIRTMLVEGDRVSYQVGGGIVADSRPSEEFLETIVKGRGMLEVLEQFEGPR